MIIRAIDFETTGLAPPDAAVCEIGWCDVEHGEGASDAWRVGQPQSMLVDPRHKIPPAMSAIHHIVDADVVGAPPFSVAAQELLKGGVGILAAHRASFERQFLTVPAQWICTWKVAILLAPHAPTHSNQGLRYFLGLAVDRGLASPPHRAGPDAYVTAHLLARALAKMDHAEMVQVTERPALLPYLTFGEHAMKPLDQVPSSYLEWILNKSRGAWDEDILHTARTALAQRHSAAVERNPVDPARVAADQARAEDRR